LIVDVKFKTFIFSYFVVNEMYYLVGINKKTGSIKLLAESENIDNIVFKWISNIIEKLSEQYVKMCQQGYEEYCYPDTIIKQVHTNILNVFNENRGDSLIILSGDEYVKLMSSIEKAKNTGKKQKITVKGISVTKSVDVKKLKELSTSIIARVLYRIDPNSVKKHKILSKYLKKDPEKIKIMKKYAKEKVTITINKYIQFQKEILTEALPEVLTSVENKELEQGVSFGTKLIIIALILMLLIYAYVKFVKQGVPLFNI